MLLIYDLGKKKRTHIKHAIDPPFHPGTDFIDISIGRRSDC